MVLVHSEVQSQTVTEVKVIAKFSDITVGPDEDRLSVIRELREKTLKALTEAVTETNKLTSEGFTLLGKPTLEGRFYEVYM